MKRRLFIKRAAAAALSAAVIVTTVSLPVGQEIAFAQGTSQSEEIVLTAQADGTTFVVEDFESAVAGTSGGWENEAGWQYQATITPTVVNANGSRMLKLNLDYTGCEGYSWSEAKVKKNFGEGFGVSSYNQLTYELIYPEALQGKLKSKVFACNQEVVIINKEGDLEPEDFGNGMKKALVSVIFSSTTTPLTDLTIGVIGVNTNFTGDVYIDNVTLSQADLSQDFVNITVTPDAQGAQADLSGMPDSVHMADKDATAKTRALYSYLQGLDAANQVLFGHQNDTHKHASGRPGVYSDTKDVTGSISGLVGIDSLALSGVELGITDTDEAIAEAVRIGKAAAAEGAILTLSTHMPNMSNSKIVATPGNTRAYDFSQCDFSEAMDLSNNCADKVLPGGAYNGQFKAYLDILADYAKGLDGIPVLFRPFHENTGGWFWWGSSTTSKESYNAMFRYAKEYLTSQGVHNFIYVYSPNGPFSSEQEYLDRYPGDDCVDIIAFDYYNDYTSYPAQYSETFFGSFKQTCEIVKSIAEEKGKVAAVSETGVRVMKADASDMEGILVKDNPMKGKNWYSRMNQIAKETGMPYFLVWANFSEKNFYVPYKCNDTMGQELINEFLEFYNEDSSIFANGTNFYGNAENKQVTNLNGSGDDDDDDVTTQSVIDDFESYNGNNGTLSGAYDTNSADNCYSEFVLDGTNKKSGSYGGSFHYRLKTNGNEGWSGRIKTLNSNNYSAYNALSMWVKPDGKGQKLVIQLTSGNEEFEVYLTEFAKTTEAKYVTIPFSSFSGKQGGSFDAGNIKKFAVWCNSIPQNGSVDIDSNIVFDEIQFVNVNTGSLSLTADGYALSDASGSDTPDDGDDDENSSVVDNFENAGIGTSGGWENEAGWQYNATVTPTVVNANGSNMLKLNLDYTGCEGYSWSEAKVKKSFSGLDVSSYSHIRYELIYPESLDGSMKAKVFAKNNSSGAEIINAEGTMVTSSLGNGMKKAVITVGFSPNTAPVTELTIGIAGVYTSFTGDVYIDNVEFF